MAANCSRSRQCLPAPDCLRQQIPGTFSLRWAERGRITIRSSRPHVVASAMRFTLRLHLSAAPPRVGLTQALGLMKATHDQSPLLLRSLHVTRMEVGDQHRTLVNVELGAEGTQESLKVIHGFTNASWLNDLESPYLYSLLNLENEGTVSLREEGWAALEDDGKWVRLSDTYTDERCAIVALDEFQTVIRLKRQFLYLMRYCKEHGVPRYSIMEGFRVRFHVSDCMLEAANHDSFKLAEA
jgi:hypothetical protein